MSQLSFTYGSCGIRNTCRDPLHFPPGIAHGDHPGLDIHNERELDIVRNNCYFANDRVDGFVRLFNDGLPDEDGTPQINGIQVRAIDSWHVALTDFLDSPL